MAVALDNPRGAVELLNPCALLEINLAVAQSHGAAEVGDILLLGKNSDDMLSGTHLLGGRILPAENIAAEFDDDQLETETQTEKRNIVLAGISDCIYLALDTARTETAGDNNAVDVREIGIGEVLGIYPFDYDLGREFSTRMLQRLFYRDIDVFNAVFSDDGDRDAVRVLDRDHSVPVVVGRPLSKT